MIAVTSLRVIILTKRESTMPTHGPMIRRLSHAFLSWLVISVPLGAAEHAAHSQQAVVASVHPLATDAGIAALRAGGNALDAAVAAAVTLGVVDSHNSGLGGGCFILARLADGSFIALDGREMAPAAASRDMFFVNGKPDTRLSQTGPLAVGVPGALAAYSEAIEKHGRLSMQDLMTPAAQLAADGFPIDRNFARVLKRNAAQLRQFPGTEAVFFSKRW